MVFSIIQKSQLEGANRLDAEYYQPEYLIYLQTLKKLKLRPLDELARKIDVGFVSSMTDHFQNDGIPLLRTQNVKEFFIDLESGLIYIDDEFHNKLKKTQILPNDVLLARSGSIGNACIVPKDFPIANSADIIFIRGLKEIIPEFLVAFLNSKYGSFQVERGVSGGLQGHINLFSLEKLLIPILNNKQQEKIKQTVLSALRNFEKSKNLYLCAENLLLEELDLKDFKPEDELFYIVNSSDLESAHRADAEYFQPKYEKIISEVKSKTKVSKLQDVATVRRGSLIDPNFYDEVKGTSYIRGRDFSAGRLEKTNLIYISQKFKPKAEARVKTGDLVFSLIGSVGALALVDEEFNNSFISNNTGMIAIKNKNEILPECLMIILQSIVGRLQFEKEASRTAQPKISDSQVRNFSIPILPKPTQQKIADLVRQSHRARKKSKELLEEAKRKVEEMIEKQ